MDTLRDRQLLESQWQKGKSALESVVAGMDFWSGRRVFLTGHTGFKGAWISALLHRLGAEVHGYSLAPQSPSLYESSGGAKWMARSTYADLRDCDALKGP